MQIKWAVKYPLERISRPDTAISFRHYSLETSFSHLLGQYSITVKRTSQRFLSKIMYYAKGSNFRIDHHRSIMFKIKGASGATASFWHGLISPYHFINPNPRRTDYIIIPEEGLIKLSEEKFHFYPLKT